MVFELMGDIAQRAERDQLIGWIRASIQRANMEMDKSSEEAGKYWEGYEAACIGLRGYMHLPTD